MTGSLQEKNGKYYAVINLTDINGKRKQKWVSTGYEIKGNKKNAEKFLRDKINEFETKANLIQSNILFSDYIVSWLERKEYTVEKLTFQPYKSLVEIHIKPYFDKLKIKLCDVTRNTIQTYVNEKSENGRIDGKGGLSAKTVKKQFIILKQTLSEAVKNGLITVNPSDYVKLPKFQRYEAKFYTVEQINNMLGSIKNEQIFPLVYFTVIYGLRRSEVLGLKWDSVNYDNNTLYIKHTVVYGDEIIEKDTTKTNSSRRSYPLTDEVINILNNLQLKEQENKKLFGNEYVNNDYIFKWDNGSPYSPDYITKKFSKLLEEHNLPHIRFHDLRHSCASLLVSNNFSMKDIQEWLGHSNFSTTANIYAHLDVKRKNNIANSMSDTIKF